MASITTYEGLQERVNASPGKTLVVFSAAWCSACKRYDPIVKAVAERDDVTASFAYVNVENARELARRLSIEYLPTSLVYENGKEVDRFVGLKSESELVTLLGD
jgi:thioredoxin-like negative regulator of GroEL